MTAALFPKPGAIGFEAVEREAMQRQCRALRFELRANPHGAPSSRMVSDAAEISAMLNRRQGRKLVRSRKIIADVPARAIAGRALLNSRPPRPRRLRSITDQFSVGMVMRSAAASISLATYW